MAGAFPYQHAMANPDESLAPFFQGIYTESEESRGLIGTIRRLGPRTYVYAQDSGSGLSKGKLTSKSIPITNHQNIAVAAAVEVLAEEVTVTLGATLASINQYADGFLLITDEDSQGTCYRIRSHPAAALSTNVILTLYDRIHTALTTSSEVHLIVNPFKDVVISSQALSHVIVPAGVPNIDITADYYFWLQTGGPCSVLADNDPASLGQQLTISTNTDGAVGQRDAITEPLVGEALYLGVSTEYSPVDLKILV